MKQTSPFRFLRFCGLFLSLAAMLWLSSCGGDGPDPEPAPQRVYLESFSQKTAFNQQTLTLFAALSGYGAFTSNIQYGIDVYRITYKTQFQGRDILASGVVSLPTGFSGRPKLLSAQRGTIFANSEAPSVVNLLSGFEIFASAGYITFIPDFIGFGESAQEVHPYFIQEPSSRATIDMMRAGLEFLREKGILHDERLFLFGYSQGGYVTVATLKELQENPIPQLRVTAAAAGAGSYDILGTMDYLINNQETYSSPAFLVNFLYAYNETKNWGRPYTDFFREPFASAIPTLLNGASTSSQINAQLNDTLAVLFQPAFLEGVKNRTETQVIGAFQENSVHDWAPAAPLRLYHSPEDEAVPVVNTESTLAAMQSRGATQVVFRRNESGTQSHAAAVVDMLVDVIPWFASFQ